MIFCSLSLLFATATHAASKADEILKLVPPDAPGALVIPSMKLLSDELTRLLEGMDRVNLLAGSRPIDQIKSATGFTTGIDDLGGAAVIVSNIDSPNPVRTLIVPVTNAETFLNGNFVSRDGDACVVAAGMTLYAKTIEHHVVLSTDSAAARNFDPMGGMAESLRSRLGERGAALLSSGELMIIGDRRAAKYLLDEVKAQGEARMREMGAPEGQAAMQIDPIASSILEGTDIALVTFDFDPLGLIVRSMTALKSQSELGALAAGGANGPAGIGLSRLPGKPYYGAISLDISGLGGGDAMLKLVEKLSMPKPPEWTLQAQSVQFAVYPSPAGVAGGILNDAVAVLQTPKPAEAKAFIKERILAMKDLADGMTREVKWEEGKAVKDVGAFDAYEVKITNAPPEMAQQKMIADLLFGGSGWRGFVHALDDAVIVTFSQRPKVLQAALDAATPAKTELTKTLTGQGAIKMMRQWMPAHADIEGYLSLGQIGQLVQQVAEFVGMGDALPMPELEQNLPPIGFGLEVGEARIETSAIVPAGVLTVIADQALTQLGMGPGNPPMDDEEEDR